MTLAKKIGEDDCIGLASEMAYRLIQSLIPIVFFLVALFGLIGRQQVFYPIVIDFIIRLAPVHTIEILTDLVNATIQGSSTGLTLIGILIALWSASGSGKVIIKGLQRAYGLSGYKFPFWYSPLLSVLLVLSLGMMLILAVYLIMFGDKLIDWLNAYFYLPLNGVVVLQALRWLIVACGIAWITAFTYALMLRPKARRLSWRTAFPGALFFLISWVSVSWLFGLYVDKINQFNPVYGTLGALIILVTWLYYSSLAFFIGGEITALRSAPKSQSKESSS